MCVISSLCTFLPCKICASFSVQLNLKFEVEVLCKHLSLDLKVSHNVAWIRSVYVVCIRSYNPVAYWRVNTYRLGQANCPPSNHLPHHHNVSKIVIRRLWDPSALKIISQNYKMLDLPALPVSTPSTVTNTPIATEEGQSQGANQPSPAPPPQPRFHFDDINITSIAGLTQHIQINPQVHL